MLTKTIGKALFCVVFLTVFQAGFAQGKADSLLRIAMAWPAEDTIKLNKLLVAANAFIGVDARKVLSLCDTLLPMDEQINNGLKKGYIYFLQASAYHNLKQKQQSLELLDKAYPRLIAVKEWVNLGAAYILTGQVYSVYSDYVSALVFLEKAYALFIQIGNAGGMALSKGQAGYVHRMTGNYKAALESYLEAIAICEKNGFQATLIDNINYTGDLYSDLNNKKQAITWYQKAIALLDKRAENRRSKTYTYIRIAVAYEGMQDYAKALEYSLVALDTANSLGNATLIGYVLNYTGYVCQLQKQYDEAKAYFERAIAINKKSPNNISLGTNYKNMGDLSTKMGNFQSARSSYEQALYYLSQSSFRQTLPEIYYSLALLHDTLEQQAVAGKKVSANVVESQFLLHMKKALQTAEENKDYRWQRMIWEKLSAFYEVNGEDALALLAYKRSTRIHDSLMNDKVRLDIMRAGIDYDYSRKEDSIRLQQAIVNEELKRQVLLAEKQKQQILLNNTAMELLSKDKEVQHAEYAKMQALLQNEQLEKQQNEKELMLAKKDRQLKEELLKTFGQEKELEKLNRQRWWTYAGACIFLSVLALGYFLYRNQLQKVRLAAELVQQQSLLQVRDAAFQKKLGDISLSALRSQMNPHFIFNCLNSINLYISKNDADAASLYISRFSRLIRLMLENSRSEKITLAAEVEALELYLQMETLRFKDKLTYKIDIGNVDISYTEIPPLLLQPFVENAIWHGLMQKPGGGHIGISIEENNDHTLLMACITDNGIGREKSMELKSSNAAQHNSFGMKLIEERISLINHLYNSQMKIEVEDLYNGAQASGTRVTVTIPV
ncbi:MAG: tetratricopeptide repeat protein [Niastella sp.]|nr:tetratricopeptide repeat protein [Niastella sp.]